MKITIIALSILLTGCSSLGDPFLEIDLGYRWHETDIAHSVDCNSNVEAQAKLGMEKGNLSYGIKHVSDLACGRPFKDGIEYTNEQVFVSYKFKLN